MSSSAVATAYVLPSALVTRVDLSRLVREVETLDGELESQKVRSGSAGNYKMPTMSSGLTEFVDLNKIDLSNDQARMVMVEQLRKLKDKAPVVHMTFACAADPDSLQKLVSWMRENAHPQTLLSVGLQPSLVGGVYLRTPNHILDLSMRSLFQSKRGVIVSDLEELNHAAG